MDRAEQGVEDERPDRPGGGFELIEYYGEIRQIHIVAVALSGGLFALRGVGMWMGSVIGMSWPVRYLSYTIDIVLLTAALLLATMLHRVPFVDPWVTTKIGLVMVYIAVGSFALRRAPTQRWRVLCFVVALGIFALLVAIARSRTMPFWYGQS
ncbi:MAG: SirB2 family protein [Steroidobacteraceae bacterium]